MEVKHTLGPWRMLPPSIGVDANWHVTDSGDTFVAHVFGFNHSVDEKSKANARMIAASPALNVGAIAMLEAIESAYQIIREWPDDRIYDELPSSGIANAYFRLRDAVMTANA
ncbi:MAG: hypothetical protein JSS23_11765 [Proteobacteria bacterium]|nr:hypothetical protein [Pseudomonadota bacterium]